MKRVHDSLRRVLERNRIVFWYDPAGEWGEIVETFAQDGVEVLRVEGNEFGTKVRIVREPKRRFLVYVPTARPSDPDNWLLDLLLQGHEFHADKVSLILEDVQLPQDFRQLVEEHLAYFHSAKRSQALRELITKSDDGRDVRRKMMSVLSGSAAEVDAMLLSFLDKGADALIDPVEEAFGSSSLTEPFWKEVGQRFAYSSTSPTIQDFAVTLFRAANPLEPQIPLHPHARVFLNRWKDSAAHRDAYRAWAGVLESELQIEAELDGTSGPAPVVDSDTFEAFDRYTLHRLCGLFMQDMPANEIRAQLDQRRRSFWYEDHADGYKALEAAVEMRELLMSAELLMESLSEGVSRYRSTWWRIDRAYRRSVFHLRKYGHAQVTEEVGRWVEKTYVNNFLLPLADRWGQHAARLESWQCDGLPPQRQFFDLFVQPFRDRNLKVFVIISDALRYEAAAEFAERILVENRWTAEVDALFGSLPSYTQLGMASLLPGRELEIDGATTNVSVDGRSASGTLARADILKHTCGERVKAIQAEDFLELNAKTDGRTLMREHDVIYIFHNRIDAIGDDMKSEGRTLEAVEDAFAELTNIIRKVANINGSNMVVTSDHGFLFQQDDVLKQDMAALPTAGTWLKTNRRFAFGREIALTPAVKIFDAAQLGLRGDWSAAFPLSLGRFPLSGSGKRYVHGGLSIQEVLIPVVRIRKVRADDTRRVDVDLMSVPAKITTGRLSVGLFQVQPVQDKTLPRSVRIGVYALDGTLLSDVVAVEFDSGESEPRLRERTEVLTLSAQADAYNRSEVELRLEETLPATSQTVVYKRHRITLQKPFAGDFDEF